MNKMRKPQVAPSIIWFPFPMNGTEIFKLESLTEYLVTVKHGDGFIQSTSASYFVHSNTWVYIKDDGSGIPTEKFGHKVIAYAKYPQPYKE